MMSFISKLKKILCLDTNNAENHRGLCKKILREYDIRGIVGEDLFPENAYDIGRAFAAILSKINAKKICVGYDCRPSSHELYKNLTKGLINSGMQVISPGFVIPTPLTYYVVHKLNLDAGIMITGSHNPANYNGFKFMLGLDPFYGNDIQKLGNIIAEREFVDCTGGREIILNSMFRDYLKDILCDFNFSKDIKVAWDIGNGATSGVIKSLASTLPGKHHALFEEMDGNFPNRPPDPTIAEHIDVLSKFVVYNGYDIGFAFDSDGDRVSVVNSSGQMIYSDQLLGVLAKDFLKKNPGAQVIADAKCSNRVFDIIKESGGTPIMERTGHSFIKSRMKSSRALLAGEMSGHFFFKDRWLGFDDGIYAALRCLEILCENKSAFEDLPYGIISPEIRIPCDEKFFIIDSIKKQLKEDGVQVVEIDGARVSSDAGWWILRASNTMEALSLRIEAISHEYMQKMKKQVAKYLKKYIPDIEEELSNY